MWGWPEVVDNDVLMKPSNVYSVLAGRRCVPGDGPSTTDQPWWAAVSWWVLQPVRQHTADVSGLLLLHCLSQAGEKLGPIIQITFSNAKSNREGHLHYLKVLIMNFKPLSQCDDFVVYFNQHKNIYWDLSIWLNLVEQLKTFNCLVISGLRSL